MVANFWPGPVIAPLTWPGATTPKSNAERAAALVEYSSFTAAAVLIVAEPTLYFQYMWWYVRATLTCPRFMKDYQITKKSPKAGRSNHHDVFVRYPVDDGVVPCPDNPTACMAPPEWYPIFDRVIGQPRGPPSRQGFGFTRQFEHVNVSIDFHGLGKSTLSWSDGHVDHFEGSYRPCLGEFELDPAGTGDCVLTGTPITPTTPTCPYQCSNQHRPCPSLMATSFSEFWRSG